MANEIKLTSFIYPGCIEVCNGSAKFVNGYLPVIARISPRQNGSLEAEENYRQDA